MNGLTGTAKFFIAATLAGAAIVTAIVEPAGLTMQKGLGILLALAAFLPAFILLVRAMSDGRQNRILGTFVGGFLFKLSFILVGVWLAVSKFNFAAMPFAVSCLAFLFAFQLIEALYFWGKNSGE